MTSCLTNGEPDPSACINFCSGSTVTLDQFRKNWNIYRRAVQSYPALRVGQASFQNRHALPNQLSISVANAYFKYAERISETA